MPAADGGAYLAAHAGQRRYAMGMEGPTLVMARADQSIDLNTRRRFDEDCATGETGEGEAATCMSRWSPFYPPVVRQWEAALYSAYTQHFLRTYVPAGYPRWYLDAVGELFSTISVRDSGAILYARPPAGYWDVLSAYGVANVDDVLSGRPSTGTDAPVWTPHSAWLIAHFLLFSDRGRPWQAPFARYMTAVHQGMPLADAAKLIGRPTRLQRDLRAYVDRGKQFAQAERDPSGKPDPLVTPLSEANGAVFEARLALDLSPATTGTRSLDPLRDRLASIPGSSAEPVRAELECRAGAYDRCIALADTGLAATPDDAGLLGWKGLALIRRGDTAGGRRVLERAMALDGSLLQPRLAYFDSFAGTGERATDTAMRAIARVIQLVPTAAGPRLALGRELVRQGNVELARRLLGPVLNGAGDTAERRAAQALFAG